MQQIVNYSCLQCLLHVLIEQQGHTALSVACRHGHELIAQYLIQSYGADVYIDNALVAALQTVKLHVAELLLSQDLIDPYKEIVVSIVMTSFWSHLNG
jgi:ankyrin repeat protein